MTRDNRPWTQDDEEYLREHYDGHNKDEVARALGRTPSAISSRVQLLMMNRARFQWTESQDAFLLWHRSRGRTFAEIAKMMADTYGIRRTEDAVKMHYIRLKYFI